MNACIKNRKACFRPMTIEDLNQIIDIETKAYYYPWTRGVFRDCIHAGYICQVYATEIGIHAYCIMSMAAGEAHILNICVHPDYQNQGIGKNLLVHLLDIALSRGVDVVYLEVRISDKIAQHLYYKIGFYEIGRRKNYYPAKEGREDAIVMARFLSEKSLSQLL